MNGIFKGHIPLREEFLAAHGLTYEEIILRVYREPYANRFLASFAPFVHAYLDCPEVRAMVAETFADFAQRNLSRYPVHLTVACIGGRIRGAAARGARTWGLPGRPDRRITCRRTYQIPLWKIE